MGLWNHSTSLDQMCFMDSWQTNATSLQAILGVHSMNEGCGGITCSPPFNSAQLSIIDLVFKSTPPRSPLDIIDGNEGTVSRHIMTALSRTHRARLVGQRALGNCLISRRSGYCPTTSLFGAGRPGFAVGIKYGTKLKLMCF